MEYSISGLRRPDPKFLSVQTKISDTEWVTQLDGELLSSDLFEGPEVFPLYFESPPGWLTEYVFFF